ncbi:MAG: methylmalonyl-CoA mutase [Alphaproteobacteria bacterium]|nr:methylmalonyl-CoA mutase [Alphaproteobacteria bacterium]
MSSEREGSSVQVGSTERDAWQARVEADVGGVVAFERKLVGRPAGRPPTAPLYTAQDLPPVEQGLPGQAPFVRGRDAAPKAWEVRVRLSAPTVEACRAELAQGATGLHLVVEGAPAGDVIAACTGGLSFEGLTGDGVSAVLASWRGAGVLELSLHPQDPGLVDAARAALAHDGDVVACTIDTSALHHQGLAEADDLAVAIAGGLRALRALEDGGIPVEAAFTQVAFRLRLDTAFFDGIAKLRALRALWNRVARACGLDEAPGARIHVLPSRRVLTRRDPWVNVLRNTAVCFAGAVGGAQAITTLPLDHELGAPQPAWQRLARNTQVILARESHLDEVVDPAGGSFFVEARTRALMEAAWPRLQALEATDSVSGFYALVGSWADEGRGALEADVARRKRPITGVSEFPLLDERTVDATPRTHDLPDAWRLAEPFEALRDRAEAAPVRPRVFLAQLGDLAEHNGRSTFTANLLQAGGIATVETPDDLPLADAFAASGCTVAVLCSTDARYEAEAAAAVTTLRGAGARQIWLAGRPDRLGLDGIGLAGSLSLGCDVVAVLDRIWQELA